jgi:hypothetical protein
LEPGSSRPKLNPGKINETALDIRVNQFYAEMIPHFQTLEPARESAFGGRLEQPYPRAFVSGAGDNRVELPADLAGQEQCRGGFIDPPLNFGGGILLIRAMFGQRS